jgi:uncharacterized membrane protein YphA (DoxX/SURF4 family)
MLRTILAWGVGIVFLYASVLKIADPADFAQSIKYYKLVPLWALNAMALLLPWWELGAGLALLVPGSRRAGAAIVFVLTCVFTGAITSAMIRGLDISCGCFGTHSSKVGFLLLAFDVSLLLATGFIFLSGEERRRGPSQGDAPPVGEPPAASTV